MAEAVQARSEPRRPGATAREAIVVADDDDDDDDVIVVEDEVIDLAADEDDAKAAALSRAEETRSLTAAQDAEYEASLEVDRRKARDRADAEAERRAERDLEVALEASKEDRDRVKRRRRDALVAEAEPTDGIRLKLRMPDGTALARTFEVHGPVADVKTFVEAFAPDPPTRLGFADAATRRRLASTGSLADWDLRGPAAAVLVVDLDA